MMYIATAFRGRISFTELLNLDAGYISVLNKMAYDEMKSNSKRQEAEVLEDAMTGNI